MKLPAKLWGGEPLLRFIIEAAAMVIAAWVFLIAYGVGYESKVLLYSVTAIAVVMVVDFLGFAAYFFWNDCR